jgi:hypothetical protein
VRSLLVAVLIVTGCKDGAKQPQRLDGACVTALGAGDAGAALRACRPCGVSFEPLVELSSTDPDVDNKGLPGPDEVFAILDACQATCQGTARTEVAALLREAADGHAPAAPWRRMAERCEGALRTDERSRRFARGTWYAFDQIARAIWADDAPAAAKALRDAPPRFPLPPLTAASTGYAFPRVDQLAAWRARTHVTISDAQIHVGTMPWVELTERGPALVSGPGLDYPGDEIAREALAARVGEEPQLLVIAPRGLRVSRVLEVIGDLPRNVYLAATPKTRGAEPWPEPVYAIPVGLAQRRDGAEPLVLPASSTVGQLADALAELARRGVAAAHVTLDPLSSP